MVFRFMELPVDTMQLNECLCLDFNILGLDYGEHDDWRVSNLLLPHMMVLPQ